MFKGVAGFFSGELSINTDSWHYRWYQYWRKRGGQNPSGYRENLCHYMRVLLIWAPLKWYSKQKYFGFWTPFLATLLLGVLALVAVGFYFTPADTGILLGVIAVGIGLIAGILFLIEWLSIRPREKAIVGNIALKILLGVLSPFLFLYWLLYEQVYRRVLRPTGIWNWYFQPGWKYVISPWALTLVAVVAICLFFWTIVTLKILASVGIFIAAIALAMGLIFGGVYWYERRKLRRSWQVQSGSPSKFMEGLSGTVKISGHYIIARKRRICPFLNLPEESREPSYQH